MDPNIIYPRKADRQTVYLKNVISDPCIEAGDYSMYNDFVNDPKEFEKNNVLYHYPINRERLVIGKYCSVACGAKFMFTSANHTAGSLSTYPFPIFFEEWGLDVQDISEAWDNKGDIIIGSDVWIGYEAVIMQGVTVGDGAVIGSRAVVTKDVEPYSVTAGVPARPVRKRFGEDTVRKLMEIRWWDWPDERVRENLDAIRKGRTDELERVMKGDI